MVKHTQRFRWQQPKNCLSVFVELTLKGLRPCQTSMMEHYYENASGHAYMVWTIAVLTIYKISWNIVLNIINLFEKIYCTIKF